MEQLAISIDDATAYDNILKCAVPECGDFRIITKAKATNGGKSAAMITFTVMIDNRPVVVQSVVTLKQIAAAGVILAGIAKQEAQQ